MVDFANLWIWQEADLGGQLSWYRQVALNEKPAKFRIAQHIPVELALEAAAEETLWDTLDAKTPVFLDLWERIRRGLSELPTSAKPRPIWSTSAGN
jgi:uncharacterized Fe-S radical SAM superfamily protein PflX